MSMNIPLEGAIVMEAPAKLNLYLHVTGRRDDGYHELDSLVAFASVGDRLRVEPAAELSLEIEGLFEEGLNADEGNLVWRAAKAVSEMAKLVKGSEKLTLSGALAGKSFDDLVGQDALSGLSSIINSLKMVGAAVMDEIGKPIAAFLKDFQENFL